MRPDSRPVHAGRELRAGDPLAPPIVQTSVYVYDDLDHYDAVAEGRRPGHLYARYSNENCEALASAVAELEGAEAGLASASGMAAISAAIHAFVPRPAPVVVAAGAYGTTLELLRQDLAPFGYEVREVDTGDLDATGRALGGAALLICETVTNPLCRATDLEAIGRMAAGAGVPMLVDNTFATPILRRPLELGATAVLHSATKYLGGHSDLMAGVLVGPRELVERAAARQSRTGGTLGPFEAWLALRGLRTLHLRMRRHTENALRLARCLPAMPGVDSVHHPGFGGMLAFQLAGGRPQVQRLLSRLQMVRFAASLAGVETTVSYPPITSHRSLTADELAARGIGPGLVRISAGLEDAEDLVDDFRQAIA